LRLAFPIRYSLFSIRRFQFFAARIAAHTFWGVAGMEMSSVPIASVIALMTAGGEQMAPA
jgi:hypothetical protein